MSSPHSDLETVFEATEPVDQMWVESLLEEAGIAYFTANEGVQNLFGVGQIGGFNLVTGPIAVRVPVADADRARDLIAQGLAERETEPPGWEEAPDEEDDPSPASEEDDRVSRYSTYSFVWAILWLGGIGSLLGLVFGVKALLAIRETGSPLNLKPIFGILLGVVGLLFWLSWWSVVFQ